MDDLKILVILLAFLHITTGDDFLVVTDSGPVRGTTTKSFTDKEVDVFYGIPYAEPPTGSLRFGPPVGIKPWTNEWDETLKSRPCYQRLPEELAISRNWTEDCLKVHMWIPKPRPINSTVMVFFHAGGFFEGDPLQPEFSGATIAAEENIIVASMNYRLDVQGFATLGIPEAPGNVGLMDQQMALKWIHRNIFHFGGNPDDITIFGAGAGSASVGYQILAQESRGLFHRAIMMSGTPLAAWAHRNKVDLINATMDMADYVGCAGSNLTKVFHCLQSISPDRFIESNWNWRNGRISLEHWSPDGPTVDGQFISDLPITLLKEKQFNVVDLMIGTTAQEGGAFLGFTLPELFQSPDGNISKTEFDILLNSHFKFENNATKKALTSFYTNSSHTLPDDPVILRNAILDMVSDYFFNCPSQHFADIFSEKSGRGVYRYVVDHYMPTLRTPIWMGTVNSMDAYLHMGIIAGGGPTVTEEDVVLSKKVMKWWANFARTGNPNSGDDSDHMWLPSTVHQEYLEISINPAMKTYFRNDKCASLNALMTSGNEI